MKWYSKRTGRRQAFWAGISSAIIWFMVVTVLTSHGQHDYHSLTWPDIFGFLFLMFVFGDCCIELYRYFELKNQEPDWSVIVKFKSKEERDQFIRGDLK